MYKSLLLNSSKKLDTSTQDPDANLVVICLGGYGIRVLCGTHGLGNTPKESPFQNALYIDFETSYLEQPDGQGFIRGGGELIRLSSTDVRDFVNAALEDRSNALFAHEIRNVWSGSAELLNKSLKAIENSTGGCGLRSVSAMAIYAAAGEILSVIKKKINDAKRFSKDPRQNTRILLLGSLDGSVGSGGVSTISYLILKKIPGIDIAVSGAFHNYNELTVFANNSAQYDLLQANSAVCLAELQRLSAEAGSISINSGISYIEIIDGNHTNLTTSELQTSHARSLDIEFNEGVDRAHEILRVNETYCGTTGVIRILGPGIEYGIPEELLEYSKIKTELKFIELLQAPSELPQNLDSLLPKILNISPPADRSENLLAANSHAGAIALASNVLDDLSRAERDFAETLEIEKEKEKNRVIAEVDTMLASSLPCNFIMGSEKALQRALIFNQKCIDDLTQLVGHLKNASNKINVDIGLENNLRKSTSLAENIKKIPRSHLISLAVGIFAGAALIFAGDMMLLVMGILMIFGVSCTILHVLKSQDPKISETIEALQNGIRARRDLLSRNRELALYHSRHAGLTEVVTNLSSLKHVLGTRRKKLDQELDAVLVPKSATRYTALNRSQFQDVLKKWPSSSIGIFTTLKNSDFVNQIGSRAAAYSEARFSEFALGNLETQSADELEKLISVLVSASTITSHHRADPAVSRPELWASVNKQVFHGSDSVRMALNNARDAKSVFVLNWRRNLKLHDLGNFIEMTDAAESLAKRNVPTRTIPDNLSSRKSKNAHVKSPNHRAANINGFSITTPEYSKY